MTIKESGKQVTQAGKASEASIRQTQENKFFNKFKD